MYLLASADPETGDEYDLGRVGDDQLAMRVKWRI